MKTILKALSMGLITISLMGCCTSQGLHDDEQYVHIRPDLPEEMLPSHDFSSLAQQCPSYQSPMQFPANDGEYGSQRFQHENWDYASYGRLSRESTDSHVGWEMLYLLFEIVEHWR